MKLPVGLKRWLKRGLLALLISTILMLIAILTGAVIGIWQALR